MTMSSTVRSVRLVYIRDLLEQSPHTIRDLALLCGMSDDTVTRDLVTLQLAPTSLPLRVVDGDRWTVVKSTSPNPS
jgi:predicted DNA-binding transcriptional regulator YafY